MANFLLKTSDALEKCKEHLQDTKSLDSPIATYLAQYLSIIFCAEMEETIKHLFNQAVKNRSNQLSDSELQEFINNQLKKLKHSGLKKGELADYVKTFSEQAKEKFNNQLENKDSEITAYNNMIINRHSVAHTSQVSQFSFLELKKAVESANKILIAMQIALQLES